MFSHITVIALSQMSSIGIQFEQLGQRSPKVRHRGLIKTTLDFRLNYIKVHLHGILESFHVRIGGYNRAIDKEIDAIDPAVVFAVNNSTFDLVKG